MHNIATAFRTHTFLSDAWTAPSLGIDNQTRWNSWYQLLMKAVKHRQYLSQFTFEHAIFEEDRLTNDDWEILEVTKRFLEPFYKATLAAESKLSSLELVIFTMESLLALYEKYSARYSSNTHLSIALDMGWTVLKDYYARTDESPAYAMAILLHPSMRLQYITSRWAPSWWKATKPYVEALWEDYSTIELGLDEEELEIDQDEEEIDFMRPSLTLLEHKSGDEFERFINSGVTDITGTSVLNWWLQEGQRKRYPRLSRLARDIFSIPPMSDEPERIFSSTRRVIRWDRASLGDSSVENIACMKHWIQNRQCESYIPQDIDLGIEDEVEENQGEEEEVLVSDELD